MNKPLPSLNEAAGLALETAFEYAAALPGGDLPRSKEAIKDYERIYKDAEGNDLPEILVTVRLLEMRKRIAAKVGQIAPIQNKLRNDGLRRSARLPKERTWDKKVLESGFLPREEFSREKRTVGKLTQEILSTDYELVGGLKDYEVSKVVIDPAKITDTLLVNLGLEEFVPDEKASELDKLARRAEAIPGIKEMLRNLEPLKLSEKGAGGRSLLRLFAITEGEYAGYVLGTQVNHGKKLLFRTDLHGAARRLDLIDQGYAEEMSDLSRINHRVILAKALLEEGKKEISEAFKKYRQKKETGEYAVMEKPELMKKYEKIIAEQLDTLGDVINGEKVKIQNQLRGSAELIGTVVYGAKVKKVKGEEVEIPEKKTERVNIGAKLAKLSAIKTAIPNRMREIRDIQRYLLADKQILKDKINNMEEPFVGFIETVEEMHEQFKVYRQKGLSAQEGFSVARNLDAMIVTALKNSFPEGETHLEPYASFKAKMLEQTEKTVALLIDKAASINNEAGAKLDEQDSVKVAKEFTKIYLIAKIVGLHKDLQKFYSGNLSGVDREMGEKALKEIEAIKKKFGKKAVAPQVEVQDFAQQYDEFYHLVNSLRKRTTEINQKNQEIEDCQRKMENMKEDDLELPILKKTLATLEKEKRRLKNAAKDRFRNFDFGKMIREMDISNGSVAKENGERDRKSDVLHSETALDRNGKRVTESPMHPINQNRIAQTMNRLLGDEDLEK
jgi:hypothetical protein